MAIFFNGEKSGHFSLTERYFSISTEGFEEKKKQPTNKKQNQNKNNQTKINQTKKTPQT